MPTASVDGASAIDASSAFGSREIASNVVAMSVNRREATGATGATVPVNALSERRNRVSPVLGKTGPSDGLEMPEQRRQARDRVVQRRAAAGERVPDPDEVLLDRAPGPLIECLEDVLELDRHGRL